MTSIGREKFEKKKDTKKDKKNQDIQGAIHKTLWREWIFMLYGSNEKKHNNSELTQSALFAVVHPDGEQVEVPRPEKNWKKWKARSKVYYVKKRINK